METSRDQRAPLSLAAVGARRIIEALPYPALLIALDDTLIAHNAPALELFPRSESADPPTTFHALMAPYPLAELDASLAKAARGGPRVVLPDVLWAASARPMVLEISISPLTDDRGDVVAILVTALDQSHVERLREEYRAGSEALHVANTELQALNEELRDANDRALDQIRRLHAAEEADARKNQFLAMLAHELRNPLATVVNALHAIQRLIHTDREITRIVRMAQRQLAHETRLLDDLLDVSRIVLGKISMQAAPVDLRDVVRSAIDSATFALQSRAQELTVEAGDVPLMVEGDATRLEQCVGNLLSNAVKFTEVGGRIAVRAHRADGHAVVVVSDSGIGLTADMLERVFGLFEQGDASLARARGGLGIGLTLARRLAELHGGTLTARSEGPGRGSQFEMRLPMLAAASPPRVVEAAVVAPTARRILIAEDNRDAREMLRTMLELDGHTISTAGDGPSAVRMAVEAVPEIVIMDIGLPGLDGFEVARRIRVRLGATIRLVALSGYGDPESKEHARQAGFDAHLVKPVSPDDLSRLLRSL